MPSAGNTLTINRAIKCRSILNGLYVDTVVWQNPPTFNQYEKDDLSLELIATSSLGNEIQYAITGGLDSALFTIDNGHLILSARDYESPNDSDGNNIYEVEIVASTSSGSDILDLSITILNATEIARNNSISGVSISENIISG